MPREAPSDATGAGASGRPPAPHSARDMLGMARAFLERKGAPDARLEAELLVAHALGLDRLGLFMRLDQPLEAGEVDRARDLLVRRGRREPTAYIVGAKEFYGRRFEVGPGCLIPRPETELLVDVAREVAGGRTGLAVLDVGTGSGCIALTLGLELEGAEVTALDDSPAALAWARRNLEAHWARARKEPSSRVRFVECDARASLRAAFDGADETAARLAGPFDLVVSNPPYVELDEAAGLAPEVREHEPLAALFAPEGDPDAWVRELARFAARALAPGGALLVELGHRQGARASALAEAAGLAPRLHADLAGHPRVLEARAAAERTVPRNA